MKKVSKKSWILIIAGLVVAIILIYLFTDNLIPKMRAKINRTIVQTSYLENLYDRIETADNQAAIEHNKYTSSRYTADSLRQELKTAQDSIAKLDSLLNKCKGIKKPGNKTNHSGQKPANKQVKEKPAKPNNTAANLVNQNSFKPGGAKDASLYKTALDGKKYTGLQDGDFYITISAEGYIQYVFAKKLYDQAGGTGAPELNQKGSGKKFELNDSKDFYIYVDKSAPATGLALKKTYTWSVYIGDRDGYEAYAPHELIKPEIIKARGELSGDISAEDVDNIGKLVPEVKAGRILPNNVSAIGSYDGLKYIGWHFKTPVLYKED